MSTPLRLLSLAFYLLPFTFSTVNAQDIRSLKHEISSLCSPTMDGRGYVRKGHERAAMHIMRKFRDSGLQPAGTDSTYYQYYTFPVVSFPDTVVVTLNKKELIPGEEYLVDAASNSYHASKRKVKTVDVGNLADSSEWYELRTRMQKDPSRIYLLKGTDSLARLLNLRPTRMADQLPAGCFIFPIHGKMTWTVATDTVAATVLYIQDSVLPKHLRKATVDIHSKLDRANKNANVVAMIPGTAVPDSFLVFTAHYDHLGRMGLDAVFPGASDNASGTALMEWLAAYYAKNPQRYSMLFIAFSGEEAGLKGSSYYVAHPTIPLSQIKFLVNLDIMGNALDGVTVVNATEFPTQFALLQSLNKKSEYLPEVRSRGKAANSDHYPFTEAGVPAFFLYSNGGTGFYHDIFDKPATLTMTNIDKVAKLLMDFVKALQ